MTLVPTILADARLPDLDDDTARALRLPVGITSPLWLMIGSAAMVGAAVFWATQWMTPVTLEAVLPTPKSLPKPEPEVEAAIGKAAEAVPAAVEAVVEAAVAAPLAAAEALAEAVPEPEVVIDPVTAAPVVVAAPVEPPAPTQDDLTVMTGIGPKLAAALAERGITRFAQIAAWSEDEIATLDREMKLIGRVTREAWVAQAKRLAGD
ncbi:MAG: helix-hairpin-helix domain-containing protein [Caulobacter sp.]|nr:helix-hairpin-helix domain-containing protein [Caulobacter sp.]